MPGTGTVRVTVERQTGEPRDWAQVSIADSGAGVSPELKPRLFEPFVTNRPVGSGLGLSIVRRVIEDHLGTLDMDSERGRGTIVVLRLPLGDTAG